MNLNVLAEELPQEWREQFVSLVETGSASEHFMDFLNGSSSAQELMQRAFVQQADAFDEAMKTLREGQPGGTGDSVPLREAFVQTTVAVLRDLERVEGLPRDDRQMVLRAAVQRVTGQNDGAGSQLRIANALRELRFYLK